RIWTVTWTGSFSIGPGILSPKIVQASKRRETWLAGRVVGRSSGASGHASLKRISPDPHRGGMATHSAKTALPSPAGPKVLTSRPQLRGYLLVDLLPQRRDFGGELQVVA